METFSYSVRRQQELLRSGEDLLRAKKLDEAFEMYRRAFNFGELELKHIVQFANGLLSVEETRVCEEMAMSEKEHASLEDILSCSICRELFNEPVTLVCGHTFCLQCLALYKEHNTTTCPNCCASSTLNYSLSFELRELIRNCFGEKLKLRQSISAAEKLLDQGDTSAFMNCVGGLMEEYASDNVELLCLRSKGFLSRGWSAKALQDLKVASELNPFKSEAFFSRGKVLASCCEFEVAVMMFLRASALKPADPRYRDAFTSCLCALFRKICTVQCSLIHSTTTTTTTTITTQRVFSPQTSFLSTKKRSNFGARSCVQDDDNVCVRLFETFPRHEFEESKEMDTVKVFEDVGGKCNNLKDGDESNQDIGDMSALEEIECKLCLNLLYKPVTTPCGHSFCHECLIRSLDHRVNCPCCRTNLQHYLELATNGQHEVCEVLEKVLRRKFEAEYNSREAAHERELKSFSSNEDNTVKIPIFVCTLAVPDIVCSLYIFEPRHKLMIRQCMESGLRQCGMCVSDEEDGFATVGTMLEIHNVEVLPDGKCIVHAVGGRRFKVLEKSTRDGYNVAKVEWLVDENCNGNGREVLNHEVYKLMTAWFSSLPSQQQGCIVDALGEMPSREQQSESNGLKWLWWLLAAMHLNIEAKLIILSMTSVTERLRSAKRFLDLLLIRQLGDGKPHALEQNV